MNNNKYLPDVCPCCDTPLEWKGVDLVCNNPVCGNIDKSNLSVWSGVLGKTDGLGGNLMFKFFEQQNINSIEDLYSKYGYGEKTCEIIAHENYSATELKWYNMMRKLVNEDIKVVDALIALNIPRLGGTSANKLASNKELCRRFIEYGITGEIDDVTVKGITDLLGPATAKEILVLDRLKNLKYVVSRLVEEEVKEQSGEMKKIAVTGSLEGMTRKQFEELIASKGYELTGNIKEAEYLVTNTPNSRKQ